MYVNVFASWLVCIHMAGVGKGTMIRLSYHFIENDPTRVAFPPVHVCTRYLFIFMNQPTQYQQTEFPLPAL